MNNIQKESVVHWLGLNLSYSYFGEKKYSKTPQCSFIRRQNNSDTLDQSTTGRDFPLQHPGFVQNPYFDRCILSNKEGYCKSPLKQNYLSDSLTSLPGR